MKPMIKYRGGKTREIPYFEKYIPKSFDTYFEPFIGGGAVFFHLEPSKAVINDVNADVINFYQEVQTKYSKMRQQLDALQVLYETNQTAYKELKSLHPEKRVENCNEVLYYRIRDMFNGKIDKEYLDAVIYFFINKTAYSGMIRYNSKGEYNVPFGRYTSFNTNLITPEHSKLLKGAEILCGDYSIAFKKATADDFMFLDPPYDCIFNDYGNIEMAEGFNEDEHRRLAQDFRNLSCKALMVIGRTKLTEDLYGKYIRDEYFKSYAVNIRNRFKSDSKHIVVMNYKEGN
ncbi:MAG: DNA adenine methylase [Lachnospiraceae bacterium]|nr:DNA adenine methylase [Lachnospiraceae bacterium]